jgi:hypothetical protein
MLKPMTLIKKLRYLHRKKNKTYHEAQFSIYLMLNDEIEKKSIKKRYKKRLKLTWVNPLITIIES